MQVMWLSFFVNRLLGIQTTTPRPNVYLMLEIKPFRSVQT